MSMVSSDLIEAKRLGRVLERDWIWPAWPESTIAQDRLIEILYSTRNPLFVSNLAGLWGGRVDLAQRFVAAECHVKLHETLGQSHAANLVQANLIELISCLGVESLGAFGLVIEQGIGEAQIAGFLEAAESGRQEGFVQSLALIVRASERVVRSVWQVHDAFDFLVFPSATDDLDSLEAMARDRRASVVSPTPSESADFQVWTTHELLLAAEVS